MLTGAQRKRLRGLAHDLQPIVHVGEAGVTAGVVASLDAALEANELVKVKLHEPEDKKGMAADLATRGRAELCGLVGHVVILYRRHPTEPRIRLA